MEEQWVVDRSRLRAVWLEHPEWSKPQLAKATGHSKAWVKKWLKRIRNCPLEDQQVLQGQSRARKHPPPTPEFQSTLPMKGVTFDRARFGPHAFRFNPHSQ